MRKLQFSLMIAMLLVFVIPTIAITYGEPDGKDHPYVGGLTYIRPRDGLIFPYCSGTLIAPQVFLTAAHCDISDITETNRVFVSFDEVITNDSKPKLIAGTFIPDSRYNQSQNDPHDIAVVLLDRKVNGRGFGVLPTLGQFNNLSVGEPFTVVGYGGTEPVPTPGLGIVIGYLDTRYRSTSTLNSITDAWLHLSQNPATGDGGSCYGDSGGPNFLGDSNLVAALTITGDAICRATNVTYRLDTAAAREFLGQFVALP